MGRLLAYLELHVAFWRSEQRKLSVQIDRESLQVE